MRIIRERLVTAIIAPLAVASTAAAPQELSHRPTEQNPRVVACRAMEVHASRELTVSVVVFHHRNKADADRLGRLLRSTLDGGPVEFQMGEADGWRTATVARLKSCFGRGLLIVSSGQGGGMKLAEGGTFLLRFPVGTLKEGGE